MDAEVVVVGAGVAGLTLAAELGRRGHTVLLIDKSAAPRDKVCGEGIMPLGLALLDALGLGIAGLPGADFAGLDYWAGRQRHTLRFSPGRHGRGLRRTALIAHLQERALAHDSVSLRRDAIVGVEWSAGRVAALRGAGGEYRGQAFVAADGVNSTLAQRAGSAPRIYGARMGLRRHYRLPPERMPPRVQVGLFGAHDVYLTPVAPDELLATTMTDRAGYRAILDRYDAFLRETPFGGWFTGAPPASEVLGWYHPLFVPARYTPGGVWLVGDASGGIDPCLGMGISMAVTEANCAAKLLARLLAEPAERGRLEGGYETWRGNLFHHYHHFGRLFRSLVTTRAGAAALVGLMRLWPGAADRILASVAERRPWPLCGDRSGP